MIDAPIHLSRERLCELVNYVPESGAFFWIGKRRGAPKSKPAGCINGAGYRVICIDGKNYLAHRLAWLYVHGQWPKDNIDHMNGDPSDNRIKNLRDTTQSVNRQNLRSANIDNKSGKLGVHWDFARSKWCSIIYVDGKRKFLGRFDDVNQAHSAYIEAKRKLHPGCMI